MPRAQQTDQILDGGIRQALGKAVMALFWASGYIVGALATAHTPALTATFWRLVFGLSIGAIMLFF